MSQHYGLILDALVIVLLTATIVYAAILSRRLSRLRDNRFELEKATRSFAEAAQRADAGIKGLKQVADASGTALQRQLDRAAALRDELQFMVEAGEATATRIERAAGHAHAQARAAETASGSPAAASANGAEAAPAAGREAAAATGTPHAGNRGRPDRDLLKAIERMR